MLNRMEIPSQISVDCKSVHYQLGMQKVVYFLASNNALFSTKVLYIYHC